MSPLVTRPAPLARAFRAQRLERFRRTTDARERTWVEPLAIFVIAYLAYASAGIYVTLALDVVFVDAQSRLENAFTVWWNGPIKLAAIGFYWPPVLTAVLMPLAGLKPAAQSFAALPLTSALFGAGLLTVLDRSLRRTGIERVVRWLLVLAFGLNPLVVIYSGNGMGEIVFLFFLASAFALFVAWTRERRWFQPLGIGFMFAFAILSRYETAAWLPLVLAGVLALLLRARAAVSQLEAVALALLVPAIYAVLLWAYLSWTIAGDPLAFATTSIPQSGSGLLDESFGELLLSVLSVQLVLFPFGFVLAAVLFTVAFRRRESVALVLALSLLVNIVTTLVLLASSHDEVLLEVRYNIRSLPIVVIALGWALAQLGPRAQRIVGLTAVAALACSIPMTAAAIVHYSSTSFGASREVGEYAYLRALLTGESQDGVPAPRGSGVSVSDQRDVAAYIRSLDAPPQSILVDDAQVFGVQLADGDPTRYLDRADVGDPAWLRIRDRPWGRVRFVLVNRDPFRRDLIVARYPGLRSGRTPPGFRRVYANATYAVFGLASSPRVDTVRGDGSGPSAKHTGKGTAA